jgi:putative ABC transport system ATP-binding protein
VQGLTKTYREAGSETVVLRDTGLQLRRGSSTSLMGVSGSGKSTLLTLIAGLIRPDAGRIEVDGEEVTGLDQGGLARLRAHRVGVVLQGGNLVPFLTAAENVELALTLGGHRPKPRAVVDLLTELGLAHRAGHLPRRLSGGEAQRASVAVALANRPLLLLADEVTGELDADTAEQVMDLILQACRERGLTVLFATHSRELAARADTRLRLDRGAVRPA